LWVTVDNLGTYSPSSVIRKKVIRPQSCFHFFLI
jgi:hypothetical protein